MEPNKYAITDYLNELCAELGPHYRFVAIPGPSYKGFIYCEHYYGRGFRYLNTFRKRSRCNYPGATARVEEDSVVILDQRRNNEAGCYADAERIKYAQPDFSARFLAIKDIHNAVCKAFKVRMNRVPKAARRIKA